MSFAHDVLNVSDEFISVAERFDKDRGMTDELNGFFSCNKYGVSHSSPKNLQLIECDWLFRNGLGKSKISSTVGRSLIHPLLGRYIDYESGRRSDTAHHYIYNQDHNKNLKILVRQRVVRILFEYVLRFRLLLFSS